MAQEGPGRGAGCGVCSGPSSGSAGLSLSLPVAVLPPSLGKLVPGFFWPGASVSGALSMYHSGTLRSGADRPGPTVGASSPGGRPVRLSSFSHPGACAHVPVDDAALPLSAGTAGHRPATAALWLSARVHLLGAAEEQPGGPRRSRAAARSRGSTQPWGGPDLVYFLFGRIR